MQKQKYPALFRNKSAINDETHDKKVLKLTNGSNTIELHVSNNIFERANNDPQFGVHLFNKYSKEILKQKSHCIGTNVSEDRTNENRQFDNYDDSENNENIGASRHHWSTEQTKLLLFLFRQLSKENMIHNRLWNEISAGMKEKGYALTASQCSTKIDSLKKAYKKCCDHNRQTGNTPKKIEHYDILCEIFAKTPWMQPLSTVGSSKPLGQHLDEESSSSG
ncbi:Trihelix transcription factor GT-2 [Cyphomyrmex costatus]|uniref:Trihelix transcription factor GT-2 n=3 Tax=Cyphomyrmex costatus TaxID=456900 RepID=A0A151I829_9HYME|nr:Trihelix transcription factor GT-2 [Cyphomyrmex costatus]